MNDLGSQPVEALETADEDELVARLQAGEEAAYRQIVRQYAPRLLTVARRYLPQEADAQDALQDAFLSAFKAIGRFEGNSKLSTWLHRIVVNASLMKLRARRRRPEKPIEDLLPRFGPDERFDRPVEAWAITYDEALEREETRRYIRRQIDELPDSYRTVLLLRDIEGYSTQEAAEILEISEGAVKTRLHRARQALKTLVEPAMKGGAL